MSSSDSEEDCYGNAAKILQSLKNKYHEDKLDSVKLLNDSLEINKIVKTQDQNTSPVVALDNTLTDDDEIDKIIALNSKRRTRSSSRPSKTNTKSSNLDTSQSESQNLDTSQSETRSRGRGRGRGRSRKRLGNQTSNVSNSQTRSPRTPRNRGRNTRGRRGRNSLQTCNIYSVGNCEEYDDLSNNVQLFSNMNSTNVQVIEDDIYDVNEELSVKVIWQSSDIIKFTIRKYQKISQIFEYFSNKANVSVDKLLFMFNDKILKPDDTPDTINYNIAKFIDGGIVSSTIPQLTELNTEKINPDGIKIKFQYPNSKKAFEIIVSKDELLSISMTKCAEHMEMPIKSLKFEFDGDSITGHMTARELDMEGGECIDVKIIS